MKRIALDTVDSTMKYLARYDDVACEDSFVLVTAEQQTEGRGQQGTSWESERAQNLLFSIRLNRLSLKSDKLFLLSEVNALALVETLDEYAEGLASSGPTIFILRTKKSAEPLCSIRFRVLPWHIR